MTDGDRFDGPVRTVNDKIVRDWLRHAHQLERVSQHEAARIEKFLRSDVLPDIMGKLVSRLERINARGYDAGVESTKRFKDLREQIMQIVDEGVQQVAKTNVKELERLSVYEARWQKKTIEAAIPESIGINLTLPDPKVLRELVKTRPLAGYGIEEWFDKLTVDTADRIEREVRIGLAEGQSVPDIARRIRGTAELDGGDGVFAITQRHAQAIARNASIHVSNQARQELFKDNEDIIDREQWVATLDTRTCKKCGALDGKVFPVGEGPMPPAHPPGPSGGACRCARVAVVRPLSEVLGRKKKGEGRITEGERASMNGRVSTSTTYSEWLKTLPQDELEEALGATRAKAFADGELTLEKMVDQSGRTLSLDELAKVEGLDLE
jgi:SPP1 gp7 family putative phage head morphogenesis protein